VLVFVIGFIYACFYATSMGHYTLFSLPVTNALQVGDCYQLTVPQSMTSAAKTERAPRRILYMLLQDSDRPLFNPFGPGLIWVDTTVGDLALLARPLESLSYPPSLDAGVVPGYRQRYHVRAQAPQARHFQASMTNMKIITGGVLEGVLP
jgi:hypothetical protein